MSSRSAGPPATRWRTAGALVLLAGGFAGCQSPAQVSESDLRGPAHSTSPSAPGTSGAGTGGAEGVAGAGENVRVVTVGDIVCASSLAPSDEECQQLATADLASSLHPDVVVALGDLQYETGLLEEFQTAWAASWGRFDDIIAPVPGNHEYGTEAAAGYTSYFDTGSYYAQQVGAWQFYLLDSNCDQIDCDQEAAWLSDQLAQHPSDCTAIAMHHPRWSSGTEHGPQEQVQGLWAAAVDGGVDVSLSAHEHDYERFAPIDEAGRVTDAAHGATHFVVGTGGRSFYPIGDLQPGSEATVTGEFGVLELDLSPGEFRWSFVDVAGDTLDAGRRSC